jgi:phage gpG-like protein
MNNTQKINVFFDRFNDRIQGMHHIIAETSTEHFKERFIQKNWDGTPWTPYRNPSAEPTKGSLMMRTNNLFSSIRPSISSPDRVTISAGSRNVSYARVHNKGLRVKGVQTVRAYTNTNFMGKNKRVQVKAHTRRIDFQMPQRQFMGFGRNLKSDLLTRIKSHYNNK